MSPPERKSLLHQLLNDPDEVAARGAVRGYAAGGGSDAVQILADVLSDERMPESVRTEAALELGNINVEGAAGALIKAARTLTDPAIVEHIVSGLGACAFDQTKDFFREYLANSGVSIEAKTAALEALGNAPGDPAPFLLEQFGNAADEIRDAAARALSQLDNPGEIGPALLRLLQQESSPEVRGHLYAALGNGQHFDVRSVLPLIAAESDPQAQLGAGQLLAGLCRKEPPQEVLDGFNNTAVPALRNIALQGNDSNMRIESVLILGKASTAESLAALEEITRTTTDRKVAETASSGLKRNR